MLNSFVIIGRLKEIKESSIIIETGYEKEEKILIEVQLVEKILTNTKEYCKIGDLIGIKGKVQENNALFGEKLTFLSSTHNNNE